MWSLLAACYVYVSLYRLKTGVLAEDIARDFAVTATAMGTLHAVFFAVYAPLQFVAGILADRYGPRVTVAVGASVMHLGAVVFALAPSYGVVFGGRLVMGVGASVVFISVLRFCANRFRADEFATMSGFTIAVSGVGGIAATYPLAVAVEAAGWRATVAALAVVGLVIAVSVYVFVTDRTEERVGSVAPPGTASVTELVASLRGMLGARQTWLIAGTYFVATGVNTTVFGLWGVPYLVQVYGVTVSQAAGVVLLGSAGLAVGPPAVGRLSDRLGSRLPIMAVAAAGFAASYGVVAVLGKPPLAVVAAAFFVAGFLIGGYALGFAVMKESHAAASATAMGTVNSAGFVGAAVFPTVTGALLDAYWTGETVAGARVYTLAGYRAGFAVAAAAGFAALILTLVLWRDSRSTARET